MALGIALSVSCHPLKTVRELLVRCRRTVLNQYMATVVLLLFGALINSMSCLGMLERKHYCVP